MDQSVSAPYSVQSAEYYAGIVVSVRNQHPMQVMDMGGHVVLTRPLPCMKTRYIHIHLLLNSRRSSPQSIVTIPALSSIQSTQK